MNSKSDNTRLLLISALERIVNGQTTLVSPNRKLSIRSVEEEANLGDGTAYYYPDIVAVIREKIASIQSQQQKMYEGKPELEQLKERLRSVESTKNKYYKKIKEQDLLLKSIAAEQNSMALENKQLREKLSSIGFLADDLLPG